MSTPNVALRELVLASGNPGKLREVRHALARHAIVIHGAHDLAVPPFPPEDAPDYRGNALLKAQHACSATGRPALADDSGLEVDALGGAPGVHSARYGGPGLRDEDRVDHLLRNLAGIETVARTARFVAHLALVMPDGAAWHFEGRCEGHILDAPVGHEGFGYDPVFHSTDLDAPFGTASLEQKRAVSHRGRALALFSAWLDANQATERRNA